MATMAVAWNNTTLNDKVKLPSITELGVTNTSAKIEGSEYPFYRHIKDNKYWWTRSFYIGSSDWAWDISYKGDIGIKSYYNTSNIPSVFRLS